MEKIENLCKKIPESEQMLALKGIGVITVAGFLAEVGDVRHRVFLGLKYADDGNLDEGCKRLWNILIRKDTRSVS